MYAVAALGDEGGDHIISVLKTELQQVMEQICCAKVQDFEKHLMK
jgi:L-lactate dehydrogenase (cytochrome)